MKNALAVPGSNWRVGEKRSYHKQQFTEVISDLLIVGDGGYTQAWVLNPEAARLIAAAPELLEALRNLLGFEHSV